MAKELYIGIGGTAKKVKEIYFGIDGVSKKVTNGYIGIGNSLKQFFSSVTSIFGNGSNPFGLTAVSTVTGATITDTSLSITKACSVWNNTAVWTVRFDDNNPVPDEFKTMDNYNSVEIDICNPTYKTIFYIEFIFEQYTSPLICNATISPSSSTQTITMNISDSTKTTFNESFSLNNGSIYSMRIHAFYNSSEDAEGDVDVSFKPLDIYRIEFK